MRKFTVEFYANNEYSVRERLQEIDNSISNIVWPCTFMSNSEGTKTKKASGGIEEETEYKLTDYEYDKENPNWRYGQRQDCVGKWKMQVVPDEEYVKFQESPDL